MQNEAKNKIKLLVEKYEQAKTNGRLRDYTEEDTKKDFILPLFAALGWEIDNRNEVSSEESIKSSGRVDYGFYLNERPKFYLEAKAFKADLNNEEFAKQAIRYSWNKGTTWAVLTDFENLKVFNAQAVSRYLGDKQYFDIPCGQFLERFDQLWLLSKPAFAEDLLDKEAEKGGKKLQKVPVGAMLYEDLSKCRDLLTKELKIWNKNLDKDLLDEGVQKILDRLIFIRVAEDRGVENPTLLPLKRQWETSGGKESIYEAMITKFRELDAIYNSNLFSEHPFEDWQEDSGITEKVIDILYGKKGYYDYDFKVMPADVLGGLYENFLGYRLAQAKKGDTGKDLKKRKEQGIYYTPPFIVEYIVKKALKPVLDKCKSISDLKKIKVLDPACGSGSFLVKALEVINEKYKEFGADGDTFTKLNIVLENLYGVDLDSQAVDIARLNLLINCLDKKIKFPPLSANIKNGNSLISGTDEELRKYFGSNFREKKPFNWEERFPEVFKQGGFDVIIGNPPYVSAKDLNQEDKSYFDKYYETAKDQYDLYILFIEKALNLLKSNAYFSFIIPNKFLITKYGYALRKFIVDNATLVELKDYSSENVFPDASVYPVVMVLNKAKSTQIIEDKDYNLIKVFNLSSDDGLISHIESIKEKIVFKVWRPLATSKNVIEGKHIVVSNREINRYFLDESTKGDLTLKRERDVEKNKIILKKLCYNLEAALDNKGVYPINTTYCIVPNDKDASLKYILGIINSKLLSFYARKKYVETALRGGYIELRVFQIEELPVVKTNKKEQEIIIDLVDKIISFNKELQETSENSDKWHKLKEEIEKTDHKIDEIVYKLYGLTEEEIKVVEEQTKK